jgi:DNA polymerase III subunit delta
MPALKPDQVAAALQRGLQRVYTVWGDETLLVQETCDVVRSRARAAGFTERQVFTVAGAHFDWTPVWSAAQSMSLFADRLLLDLRIPSGKPGKEGAVALQRLVAGISPDVLLLVQLPRLDAQQLKSGWFAALEAAGPSVRVDTVERKALPEWLAKRLAAQGQRVAEGVEGEHSLAFIADHVEGNLLAAHQELLKLGLLHPPGTVSAQAIEASVLNVARYDVGALSEAVLLGQVERALRVLEGLRAEGESAVLVHWSLTADVIALRRAREALDQGRPMPMALQEARVWGLKQRLFEGVLPRLNANALADLVTSASLCDGVIKGLPHARWPNDPWLALRVLVLSVLDATTSSAQAAQAARSARSGARGATSAVPAGGARRFRLALR